MSTTKPSERTCWRCKVSKPLTAEHFSRDKHDGAGFCRLCKACNRLHVGEYHERARAVIRAAKDRSCMDCGVAYPFYVMQFDHRPGEVKLMGLNRMASKIVALDKVKTEIAKCDVVCANYHATRTYNRSQKEGTDNET